MLTSREVQHAGEVSAPGKARVRVVCGISLMPIVEDASIIGSMRGLLVVIVVAAGLALPGAVQAASVAYVDGGGIWVSKLDGSRKVMLADASSPPVDASEFRDVTAADSGRIVGVRRPATSSSQYSWFQVFEPDGSSTVQGSLPKTGNWSTYAYPTALDITADGESLVYGYSNSSCCYTFAWGTYVMAISAAGAEPFDLDGPQSPSVVGTRIVANRDDNATYLQDAANAPRAFNFTQWSDSFKGARANGYKMGRTDVAANGTLAAGEFVNRDVTPPSGGVLVYSIASPGGGLTGTIRCDLPAQGMASDVSISQDAKLLAWRDDGGVKVAGVPTGQVAQPDGSSVCTLGSAPIVISVTGTKPSIGGADVDVLSPPAPGTGPSPPSESVSTKELARGFTFTVRVRAAGPVTLTVTVPAKRLGRHGKPIVIAAGRATARKAGRVTVKLRLNATGRRKLKRLKGARLTLTARYDGRRFTTTVLVGRT